jgi:AraC family transcriptional regulator
LDNRDELPTEIRLADAASYSVTHIRRVFYAAMGESLGDFMLRVRLERAAGLLSLGNQPIIDVALAANYQSGEAFARAFRARFQSPPTLFRALNQGEAHLLPGYVYSKAPSKSSGRMEVGLCMSIGRITTYVYDGLSLIDRIRPDSPAGQSERYSQSEDINRDQRRRNG